MTILIWSAAASYMISGNSLHLCILFSQFTKQAGKPLLRKAERLNSSASRSTDRSSLVSPHKWKTFLCQPNWLRDNNFTPFMWQLRWQFPESCNIYLKYLSSLVTDQRNAAFGNDFQLTWSCWSRVASEALSARHRSADRKTIAKGEDLTHLFHANFGQFKNLMICIWLMTRDTKTCNTIINPSASPPDKQSSEPSTWEHTHEKSSSSFPQSAASQSDNKTNKTLTTLPGWTNTTAVLENISWTAGDYTSHQKERTQGARAPSPQLPAFLETSQCCWLHAG